MDSGSIGAITTKVTTANNTIISNDHLIIDCNSVSTTIFSPSNHQHSLIKHSNTDLNTPPILVPQQHQQPQPLPPQPQQPQQQYHLTSTNSFELNVITSSSLSEDSGLPPTANSSISSGDSTRMGFCRFEFEVSIEKKK